MNIKTDSIIDIIEVTLNKKIDEVTINDLDYVKYLRVCKNTIDDILTVDSNDLKLFKNLLELSIEGCMIDTLFIDNISKLTNLTKISFINCEFVDDAKDYFENLKIDTLVLNTVLGLNDITFANINKLVLINCDFNIIVNNIDVLDISRSLDIKIDLVNSYFKEIIISSYHTVDNYLNNECKISIKNDYDEVIKVIDNG